MYQNGAMVNGTKEYLRNPSPLILSHTHCWTPRRPKQTWQDSASNARAACGRLRAPIFLLACSTPIVIRHPLVFERDIFIIHGLKLRRPSKWSVPWEQGASPLVGSIEVRLFTRDASSYTPAVHEFSSLAVHRGQNRKRNN